MTRRALVFGSAAAAYERFRLGYPEDVAAVVLPYAQGTVRTALEIGAGTGKATRMFAAHGIEVIATEPDAAMIDQLRHHVPGSVTVVRSTLEDLSVIGCHDLVYAAASLHWTEPEQRWARIAALLVPGGVFASFGSPTRLTDPRLDDAVRDARAPWLAADDVPSPDGTAPDSPMQWPGTELERSELFTDVRQLTIERRLSLPAEEYVGLLSTISAYLELPTDERTRAFEAIRGVLPSTVAVTADVHVHLARRN